MTTITLRQYTAGEITCTLTSGGLPVDITGEIQIIVFTEPASPSSVILTLNGSVGTDTSVATFTYDNTDTAEQIDFAQWVIRTENWCSEAGDFIIQAAPDLQGT